ncbi:MAG: polymer-forming cytoskeletal protein [Verrucomicrobiota bacterium]
MSYLNNDVEIIGTVSFEKRLSCLGTIRGEIRSPGFFIVAHTGRVHGDIDASTVSIVGKVKGNVLAAERCELHPDAQLIGDLTAPLLSVAEGAILIGNCHIVPPRPNLQKRDSQDGSF